MRVSRIVSLGWGATLLLLTFSILAAFRLVSIGAETTRAMDRNETAPSRSSDGIIALILPSAGDYVSAAINRAIVAQGSDDGFPFYLFAPGLPPFLAESDAMIQTLDVAFEAGVEAMLVRPDTLDALERSQQIAATGLPTAIFGSLLPQAAAHLRVGVDPAELGEVIGGLLQANPHSRVGYLCGLCSGAEAAAAQMLLNTVDPAGRAIVQRVDDRELGSIAAAGALLRTGVNEVFCDTAEATIAMAQVIIDSNLVGQVRVIGFGTEERVLSLVDDRVVAATMEVDYEGAALQSVHAIRGVVAALAAGQSVPVEPVTLRPVISVIRAEDERS